MSQHLPDWFDTCKRWARESTCRHPVFLMVKRGADYAHALHNCLHPDHLAPSYFEKFKISIKEVNHLTAGAVLTHCLGNLGLCVVSAVPVCPFKGFTAIICAPDQISYAIYRTGGGLSGFASGELLVTEQEKAVAIPAQPNQDPPSHQANAASFNTRPAGQKLIDKGVGQNEPQETLADHAPLEQVGPDGTDPVYDECVDDGDLDGMPEKHEEPRDKVIEDLRKYVNRPGFVVMIVQDMQRRHPGSEKGFLQFLASQPELQDLAWQVKLELDGG